MEIHPITGNFDEEPQNLQGEKMLGILKLFLCICSSWSQGLDIQLPAEPNTLDPFHVSDVVGFNIVSNLHTGLMQVNKNGVLENGLAETVSISKDKKVYTFKLRKGITYSDGSPILPEHFLFSFRRALLKSTAARDANFYQNILNSENPEDPKFGIEVQNNTLVIRLKKPDSSFLSALSMPLVSPMKPDFFDKEGKWKVDSPTSGFFRISLFQPDKEIQLLGRDQQKIRFRLIREETTAINLFETNSLDVIVTIPPEELERIKKSNTVLSFPSASNFFLSGNLTKPPFQDANWRKALYQAIDLEDLAKLVPGAKVSQSYLPSSLYASGKSIPRTNEPIEWALKQKDPQLVFFYPNSGMAHLLAQRLQMQWKKKLNLTVKLEPMEWKSYLAKLSSDAPALFFLGYSAPFPDVMSHLKVFQSMSADNRSKFSSKNYDQWLEELTAASDKEKNRLIQKMLNLLIHQEQLVFPLLEKNQVVAVSKRVKEFSINPFGVMNLREVKKTNE